MNGKEYTLFDICANNHGGDALSKAANIKTDKAKDKSAILKFLSSVSDATCDEVEQHTGLTHQTCSARMSELKRTHSILATVKRATRTGSKAQAWRLAK